MAIRVDPTAARRNARDQFAGRKAEVDVRQYVGETVWAGENWIAALAHIGRSQTVAVAVPHLEPEPSVLVALEEQTERTRSGDALCAKPLKSHDQQPSRCGSTHRTEELLQGGEQRSTDEHGHRRCHQQFR